MTDRKKNKFNVPETITKKLEIEYSLQLPENYIINLAKQRHQKQINHIQDDLKNCRPFNYVFQGPTGTGKTFLANIIKKSMNKTNQNNKFASDLFWQRVDCCALYQEYLDNLSTRASNQYLYKQLKKPNVILEDIGTENPITAASKSFISSILLQRFEATQRKFLKSDEHNFEKFYVRLPMCTIITTNLTYADLIKNYDDRVADRLYTFTFFEILGDSFRKQKPRVVI